MHHRSKIKNASLIMVTACSMFFAWLE